jgi:uncharacterized membrane protein (DUF2068 family)
MTLLLHHVVAGLVLRAASRGSAAFLASLGLAQADLQKRLDICQAHSLSTSHPSRQISLMSSYLAQVAVLGLALQT